MKIFLTGGIGVGKSTCIKQIIEECLISVCGFQTLPFYGEGKRLGFYLHALVDIEEQDVRFSIQHDTYNEVIPHVFDTYGVSILEESRKYPEKVMILDEIGRLERNDAIFLKTLWECIENHPNIIGVLKKCEIQYIQEIAARKDVIVYDLDACLFADVKAEIKRKVMEEMNEEVE